MISRQPFALRNNRSKVKVELHQGMQYCVLHDLDGAFTALQLVLKKAYIQLLN